MILRVFLTVSSLSVSNCSMLLRLSEITERATAAVGMSEHEFQNCLLHFQATDRRYERDVLASQERQKKLRHDLLTLD